MSALTAVRTEPVDLSVPPAGRRSAWQSGVAQSCYVVGLVLLWVVGYLLVLSNLEFRHAQGGLYSQIRTELALGTAPTGAPITPGEPIGVIGIPALEIDALVVVEGIRSAQLIEGPGHAPGSVLPGQQGVSVIAGKSLTYGAPFRALTQLRRGDPVTVTTGQGRFVYRVSGTRRAGAVAPAAPAATGGRLTLVTSIGIGAGRALRRSEAFYVDADLVGPAVARGVMSGPDPQGIPMKSHATAGLLAQIVLALQLLGLVLAGATWAWHRWSQGAAWLVGAPSVLAALWVVCSLAGRLVPGLV